MTYFKSASTVNDRLNIEQAFLATLLDTLQSLGPPGDSFNPQTHKDLFSPPFIEDPCLMADLFDTTLKQLDEANKSKTKKEKSDAVAAFCCKHLELITLRHRLVTAALETEALFKIYKKQANEMGFDDFHLFMRYVQLEFAKPKDQVAQTPPLFVTDTEEAQMDRYVPNSLCLAAQELDEGCIGRPSFKTKEAILQILTKPGGIENLQVVLKLQVTHNNALIAAIMQAHSCFLTGNLPPRRDPSELMIPGYGAGNDLTSGSIKYSERLDDSHALFTTKQQRAQTTKSAKTGGKIIVCVCVRGEFLLYLKK